MNSLFQAAFTTDYPKNQDPPKEKDTITAENEDDDTQVLNF